MNTEGWVAVMVTGIVILMTVLSPPGQRGKLPRLETIDRPAAAYRVPLFGSIARRMNALTWRLESIPVE